MKLTFCPLYSGSGGNATLVCGGKTRILIDSGMSGKLICDALEKVGVLPETIDGIFVTHEHTDHTKSVGIMSRKYHIPVYANERTWNGMAKTVGEIGIGDRRIFDNGSDVMLGDLMIHPFSIPHDAVDPVGYRVEYLDRSVAIATDMGHMLKRVFGEICHTDLVLLESNHDPDLLMQNPHYSLQLKQRILSDHGHLSNEVCAKTLVKLCEQGLRRAVLGHLSPENNTPELALNTALNTLTGSGVEIGKDMIVDMSWRDRPGNVYTIE